MLRLGKKIIKMSGGGMTALSIAAATMIASGTFIAGDEASAVNLQKPLVLNLHFGVGGPKKATGIANFGGSSIRRTRSMTDLSRTPGTSSYNRKPLVLPKSESTFDVSTYTRSK